VNQKEIEKIFRLRGLLINRMISASKSIYRQAHPEHRILFNANIFIKKLGKIWYGDLDITKEAFFLQEVANESGKELIVVPEMFGRFGAEDRPFKKIMDNAYAIFTPHKKEYLSRVCEGVDFTKIGKTTIVGAKGVDWEKITIK